MQKHSTHKSESGFTLIELLIAIAIIAILASVAIPQYNQYKIRGYDAQTKQALKNMHLLCNAYWLDTSTLQGCDLSKIKEETYGFNQNADVVATLPPSPQESFCASAKHNDSSNTFSIDSAALISSGSGCNGAGGSTQTASLSPAQAFESYNETTAIDECQADPNAKVTDNTNPTFALVGPDGKIQVRVQVRDWNCHNRAQYHVDKPRSMELGTFRNLGVVPPNTTELKFIYTSPNFESLCAMLEMDPESCKEYQDAPRNMDFYTKGPKLTYNFETGTVSNESGHVFKNGVRVE